MTELKTIGILGSGQLGRMTAIAAAQMGIRVHIFAPDATGSPAAEVAHSSTQAAYEDETALAAFGRGIDAVTSEFENVPAATMDILSEYCPVSPGHDALHVAQNRLREKTLAADLGIATPAFWAVRSADDLAAALLAVNGPELNGRGVLKTTEQGYDGKGQMRVSAADDAGTIWAEMRTDEAILESFIDFTAEVSFLVWRDKTGQAGVFPPALNTHKDGILATSISPAPGIEAAILTRGAEAAMAIAEAVNLNGVLAMEAFVSTTGEIIFNEIAPRPHNSFHWTIEGCVTSQFAQLVRIIAGLGPGDTSTRGVWQMDNLLGEDLNRLNRLYADGDKAVHLYGKSQARNGRKMGHVTWQTG